jgi:hypothetical protein
MSTFGRRRGGGNEDDEDEGEEDDMTPVTAAAAGKRKAPKNSRAHTPEGLKASKTDTALSSSVYKPTKMRLQPKVVTWGV